MFFKKKKPARPTAREVAERLVVLQQVVTIAAIIPPREYLAVTVANWSPEDRRGFAQEMSALTAPYSEVLRTLGFWSKISPSEAAFFRADALTLTEQQHRDATWRTESLTVMMWALGILPELTPPDTQVDLDTIRPHFVTEIPKFLNEASLRDQAEIDEQRGHAESWHWRSRTRQLIEEGNSFPASPQYDQLGIRTFDDIVRFVAPQAIELGTVASTIDDDFPVKGKAYRDLTEEEWAEVRSISMERHFALNWLCGYAPGNQWDKTPTDT